MFGAHLGANGTDILIHTLQSLFFFFAVLLKGGKREEEKPFRDCADVYHAGFNKSGIYTIYINNMPEPKKVKTEVFVYEI
jgi:angiopoietin 1